MQRAAEGETCLENNRPLTRIVAVSPHNATLIPDIYLYDIITTYDVVVVQHVNKWS